MGATTDRWRVHRRASGTDVVVDGRPGCRHVGPARPGGHRGVARHPAGRRPHLGVRGPRSAYLRGPRWGSEGVDTRWGVSCASGSARTAAAGDAVLALALPRGRAPGGLRPRPGGDPHRRGALAPQPDHRHRRLARRALRAQAAFPAPAGRRPCRTSSPRRRRAAPSPWSLRHDVAGLQRVGRLQPLLRPPGTDAAGPSSSTGPTPGARRERLRTAAHRWSCGPSRLGIPLAYLRQRRPRPGRRRPRGARGYVSMGHDEYWTPAHAHERSSARATPARTWPSSARTRCTGGSAWMAGCRPGYRSVAALDPLRATRPAEATSHSVTCRRPNRSRP